MIIKSLVILLFDNNKKLVLGYNGFFKFFTKMIRTQGIFHTVKYFKQVRLHVTRYLCGQPLFVNDLKIGLDKSGFPKVVLWMKEFIDSGNIYIIRFCLTLLMITRTFKHPNTKVNPAQIDIKNIIEPFKGRRYTIPNSFIKSFICFYQFKAHTPIFDKRDITLSTKASPYGPSSLTALHGILQLSYQQLNYMSKVTSLEGFNWVCELYKKA